ncbi:Ammonium transporter Rh type B [Harpegnathos saltator]|uniref:Ammonium transporter Rh type B n=1 Tax=Harpegnathos saltator TaxID=610380 RepID=E2C152_HARSA|nr:Ammonium transporter Rh type B [Harpegnathos saltator]
MFSSVSGKQQVLWLFLIQIVLIVLMGTLMTYGPEASVNAHRNHTGITAAAGKAQDKKPDDDPLRIYPMYQDVHVMIWVGFGFLMTFLKRYGQSAAGLTFLVGAVLVQVALICNGVTNTLTGAKAYLSLKSLLDADVAVAAPLISMGALLGKTTYMQLIFMGIAELIMFNVNKFVGEHMFMMNRYYMLITRPYFIMRQAYVHQVEYPKANKYQLYSTLLYSTRRPSLREETEGECSSFKSRHSCVSQVVDAGDSMFVHVFGAYFGLAVSYVFGTKKEPKEHELEGASYQSDIFAMIGTLFLWLFWPSFNSAGLTGDDQQRAIINTLLSISASCVTAFAVSALVSNSKFNMVHVQNSTLAGGVAIGTAAGMMCGGIGALAVGALSGIISVLGYKYLTPIIQKHLRIHDTCGVHNLHGMPGVLAGVFGALMAVIATEAVYDYSLYDIFPARAPSSGQKFAELRDNMYDVSPGYDRTAYQQAGFQLLALVVTLGISIVSGLITGHLMHVSVCGSILEEEKFDDKAVWDLEEETFASGNNRVDTQIPMGHM